MHVSGVYNRTNPHQAMCNNGLSVRAISLPYLSLMWVLLIHTHTPTQCCKFNKSLSSSHTWSPPSLSLSVKVFRIWSDNLPRVHRHRLTARLCLAWNRSRPWFRRHLVTPQATWWCMWTLWRAKLSSHRSAVGLLQCRRRWRAGGHGRERHSLLLLTFSCRGPCRRLVGIADQLCSCLADCIVVWVHWLGEGVVWSEHSLLLQK